MLVRLLTVIALILAAALATTAAIAVAPQGGEVIQKSKTVGSHAAGQLRVAGLR